MFAGKTLAEIALALEADPSLADAVRAELQSRIDRPNARPGSVKRAQAALDRMQAGASVAIPPKPEKPAAEKKPAGVVKTTHASTKTTARKAKPGDELTLNEAIAIARRYGYPIARVWTALAKSGTVTRKA